MLYEYNSASNLTQKECDKCLELVNKETSLSYVLTLVSNTAKLTKNRKTNIDNIIYSLDNPPYSLSDQPEWISDCEYTLLGYSLSCSKVDLYDISMTNVTCKEFKNGYNSQKLLLGGEITGFNVTKTKTGKTKGSDMAFLTLQDNTGSVDSVIFFPETYKKYRNILFLGHVIIVQGARSRNGDSFVVEKTYVARS
jgi:DNA polymerase III alpha subunit